MYRTSSSFHSSLPLRPQLAPRALTIAAITQAVGPLGGSGLVGAVRAEQGRRRPSLLVS